MTNVKIASTYHIQNANVTLVEPATVIKVTTFTQILLLVKWLFLGLLCSGGKNGIRLYMESDKDVKNDTLHEIYTLKDILHENFI